MENGGEINYDFTKVRIMTYKSEANAADLSSENFYIVLKGY